MKLRVLHRLTFTYDRPVFVEPLAIRLRPRCDATQHLDRHALTVEPTAARRNELVDAYGNDVALVWFQDLQDRVEVTSDWEVTTLRANPFDFLIPVPAALKVPFDYPHTERSVLAPYLRRAQPGTSVDELAREVLGEVQAATVPFLGALSGRIHERCRSAIRPEGDPAPAAATLARGTGACRDLAVLFMDACRSVGLAARFASGYKAISQEDGPRHLHAWAEVYLPGAGWRGWDPSLGLAVADAHVLVAAAPDSAGAAPTTGSFRGSGVRSALDYAVDIDVLS